MTILFYRIKYWPLEKILIVLLFISAPTWRQIGHNLPTTRPTLGQSTPLHKTEFHQHPWIFVWEFIESLDLWLEFPNRSTLSKKNLLTLNPKGRPGFAFQRQTCLSIFSWISTKFKFKLLAVRCLVNNSFVI